MPLSLTSHGREVFGRIAVGDPTGQRSALLNALPPSTTMAEVRARALSQLRLSTQVDWNLRCERTGRLLRDEQRLTDLSADDREQVELTLQPDAALG